ncbi:hypothetical protein [Paraburkholderia lacunae]|uniref:Uncharacterized protein n=1 Tax=Paraburkholderia lacunae TaxID=2211104 RepID=A0A370N920_9BURK|nr:hypothetical protein [Paraburkholderia lacunae]RDK02091.1 hypothetical protein DLM46_14195 [Paraburkholderia lacunae]
MRHAVIGLFDTYSQAEIARDTLVQTGFAFETIELQANPEPSVDSATEEVTGSGVLANIERFLASLFASGPRPSEAARYAEAVRRGAVLVCVNAASESHAELARNTLRRLGATDVGERSPDWDAPLSRDHSILDELGIGAVTPGTPHMSSATSRPATKAGPPYTPPPPAERPATDPLNEPVSDPLVGDAGRTAIAAGSMPGSGAVMQPSEVVPETGQPHAGIGEQVPNEYLEYEEDFRSHYDEQYAADSSRYEDYVPAYRYGAEIGRDARYRDKPWDDVEPEARRHWESTSPESTWERFKLAVRHGWERVTGHHHV